MSRMRDVHPRNIAQVLWVNAGRRAGGWAWRAQPVPPEAQRKKQDLASRIWGELAPSKEVMQMREGGRIATGLAS